MKQDRGRNQTNQRPLPPPRRRLGALDPASAQSGPPNRDRTPPRSVWRNLCQFCDATQAGAKSVQQTGVALLVSTPTAHSPTVQSRSENSAECSGEEFWIWPRRRSEPDWPAEQPRPARAGCRPSQRRPKPKDQPPGGFRCKGPSGFVAPRSEAQEGCSPSSRLALRPFPPKQRPAEFSDRL